MWQRGFVAAVLRHRRMVVAAIAVVSIVAAVFAARLGFDTNLENWFLENDPTLVSYREFKDYFGADRIGVVAVVSDDVFTPENLARVDRLTRALEEAPHVNRVLSLTTARVTESVDGGLEITDLVEELPDTTAEAQALRTRILDHPLLVDNLVGADGKATAIVVELTPKGNTPAGQRAFVTTTEALVESERAPGVEIHFAGSPILAEKMITYSQRDFQVFGPAGFVLLVIIGFLVFRRLSAALVPLPVVLLAVLWTFGVMGALDRDLTVISPMLVLLIMAIGVADTVHILSDYYRYLMAGDSPGTAVEHSVAHLFLPCLFTSATTAGGLLALRVSDLQPLSEFGTFAALGVTFAFLLSVTLVPVLLGYARPPDPEFVERQRSGPLMRLLDRLGRRGARAHRVTVGLAAVLGIASIVLALQVDVMANPLNFFRNSDPMKRATIAIDEKIGGSSSIELLVKTGDRGLLDPDILQRLADFQEWIEKRPGVAGTLGATDLLRDMDRTMRGGEGMIPDSRALAAQYFLLLEGEDDFGRLIQSDYSVGRITTRVNLSRADVVINQLPVVEKEIERRFPEDSISVEMTGFVRLVAKMDLYLIRSQIRSLLLALVVITTMMAILLRSVKLGLFSMIPNLLPVLFGIAFMTLTGIHLDQGTVMIPPIALGLVVDDSVHFLYRYRTHVLAGLVESDAVHRTMIETGRPIFVTSLILASGFGVIAFGSFNPAVFFGLISAVVVLAALVATLVLLPAALAVFRPRVG